MSYLVGQETYSSAYVVACDSGNLSSLGCSLEVVRYLNEPARVGSN